MKKQLIFIAIAAAGALAACSSLAKVSDVPTRNLTVNNTTMRQAIFAAGQKKGWSMYETKQGVVDATLSRRGHEVQVTIPYTDHSYAIHYKNSTNMYYNAKKNKIHRKYNQWVRNLDLEITRAAEQF